MDTTITSANISREDKPEVIYTLKFLCDGELQYTCQAKHGLLQTIPFFLHATSFDPTKRTFVIDHPYITKDMVVQYMKYVAWRKNGKKGTPPGKDAVNPYIFTLAEYFQDTLYQDFYLPATKLELVERMVSTHETSKYEYIAICREKEVTAFEYIPWSYPEHGIFVANGHNGDLRYYKATKVDISHSVQIPEGYYTTKDVEGYVHALVKSIGGKIVDGTIEIPFDITTLSSSGGIQTRCFFNPIVHSPIKLKINRFMYGIPCFPRREGTTSYYGKSFTYDTWNILSGDDVNSILYTSNQLWDHVRQVIVNLLNATDGLAYYIKATPSIKYDLSVLRGDFPLHLTETTASTICTEYVNRILSTPATSNHRKMATFATQNRLIAALVWREGREEVCRVFHSKHQKIDDLDSLFQKNDSIARTFEPAGHESVINDQGLLRIQREHTKLSDEIGTLRYIYQNMSLRKKEMMIESDTDLSTTLTKVHTIEELERKWDERYRELLAKETKKTAKVAVDRIRKYKGYE